MRSTTSASPHPVGPTSPPESPLATAFSEHHSRKRWHGLPQFPDSASSSNGEVNRIGNTTTFNYTRQARLTELSPQSSTLDSDSSGPEPRSLTPSEVDGENVTDIGDADADMNIEMEKVEEDNNSNDVSEFEVEEVRSSDIEPDSDAELLEARRPDSYEDAESMYSRTSSRCSGMPSQLDSSIMKGFRDMNCDAPAGNTGEHEEAMDDRGAHLQRRRSERRKRWSLGSLKRRITESLGSESDEEDKDVRREDAMEVGGDETGGRRLRRKVGDRVSLSPENVPPPIAEETNEGSDAAEVRVADQENDAMESMDIDGAM